jgi:uncharacterized protein
MNMHKLLIICLFSFISAAAISQQDDVGLVYTYFYYENGAISSEGYLLDGKPDGYWKTYYPNGILKSEGNRKEFELDSLWLFYDEEGRISLEINYKEGKKHGERVTYLADEVVRETFANDIKHGPTKHYSNEGKLLRIIPFENGLENGLARFFDAEGNIIELITYQRGFVTGRERINRYDANNQRNGVWKWFYENDVMRSEGVYRHGMRHGIFKDYDRNGNLVNITKYVDDVIQESVAELARLEIRRDYYPTGQVKVEATFRNGVPEGVRREFSEEGEIERSFFFRNGIVVAEGILSENGQRQGLWTEYYPDGRLRARGTYTDDKRTGTWEFYYESGQLEQRGIFDERGLPSGKWIWYYEHGGLLREEHYVNGLLDGMMTEYDSDGNILTMGDYIEGLEEGFWFFEHGDHREEGEYSMGMRNGQWKYYYGDGSLSFEGRFIDDNPNGTHIWYYPNGRKREEGQFVMGRRNGDWVKYNDDGTILITIGYANGIERRYDGINIPEDELIIVD